MTELLKAPFPWFGGKSRVAPEVWEAFGNVDNYTEPFAGSLAVLLARPHEPQIETVNDIDAFLSNFWRAVQADPGAVAQYADWLVNETDLYARHNWLVNNPPLRERLENDPEYYDAKIAGWWVWGICAWIGSGWCSGRSSWGGEFADGKKCHVRLPHLGAGMGVHRQLPHLGNGGKGVHRQRPHLGNGGKGVHRSSNDDLLAYMQALAARLRRVRVCCGDWSRVVTDGALDHGRIKGVFLDPPYSQDVRDKNLYTHETDVAEAVRDWAIDHGDRPDYRIALCGYESEYVMPPTWRVYAWKAKRSYGRSGGPSANSENRSKERIWFSPACLRPGLF